MRASYRTTVAFGAILALAALAPGAALAAPTFTLTDVAASVGLVHVRELALPEACDDGRNCALPWAGTVGAEDIDGDGDLDLYFTLAAGPGVLYQNQGGVFVDVTAAAGLDGAPVGGGVSLVDIDGDGDRDLLINPISTSARPATRPYLYLSDASARAPGSVPSFVEVGGTRGLVVPRQTELSGMGVAVGDYDLDGALDVYFADWRDRVSSCEVAGARLFRSRRGMPGYFEHASLSAGVWARSVGGYTRPYSFGAAFTDLDRDGVPDLLVTSDIESSELYWGRGDGSFEPGGLAAGVATDRTGMGSTLADYDNDGDLDLFVSAIMGIDNQWDGNRLYRHDGPRSFTDQTDAAGLRDVGWAWGAVFTDLDNDGDVDLAVTSGVAQSYAAPAGYADTETKVFLNPDGPGAWEDESDALGIRHLRLGRELVALDYDQDGDQDLLIVPHVGPPVLLRNDPALPADWLDARVTGAAPALEAIGAFVEAHASDGSVQVREVGTRAHFTGHGPRTAHFGFGPGFFAGGGSVELRVRFRDGGELVRSDLVASGVVDLHRADASPATATALPIPPPGDCDGDGYPDQCQPDCDLDQRPDRCQLLANPAEDCDDDRILDVCAINLGLAVDCDTNGVPDVCQVPPVCGALDAGVPELGPPDLGPDASGPVDQGVPELGAPADAGRDAAPADGAGFDALTHPVDSARGMVDAARADGGPSPPGVVRGGGACAVGVAESMAAGATRDPRPALAGLLGLLLARVRRRRHPRASGVGRGAA